MKTKPYVGITGFMSRGEVLKIRDITSVGGNLLDDRLLMVGVLASLKTIKGIENKWPGRYPKSLEIKDIFSDDPNFLNLIHYNTKEPESLHSQLTMMTGLGGENMHGFQLNLVWPEPAILEGYKKSHPDKIIVLQVGAGAYEVVGKSPKELARRVIDYAGLVEYVLLDPSGGAGKFFDPSVASEQISELSVKCPNIILGVAGGLNADNLEEMTGGLFEQYPDICIDAEGQLRTPQPEDNLDMPKALKYVVSARLMLQRIV